MIKKINMANLISCIFFLFLVLSARITANITYTLHKENNPTQDQQEAYRKINTAMDSAVGYYNEYTSITKALNVYYNTDVKTADASFNGTIRFGSDRSYMVVHTAMHEIAHTVGIGTTNEYRNLIKDGDFTGENATEMLREITSDPSAVLHGDNTHFWPYGLNYAHEVESQQDLINHCKIVNAINKDMFKEELYKVCRLKSHEYERCIVSDGSTLKLGNCDDSSSLVRLISLNEENVFRLEFGNKVLDIPNESTSAGIAAGLYNWNGGGHQRVVFEFESDNLVRLKMFHSGLYLRADGDRIIQDTQQSQYWELFDKTAGSIGRKISGKQNPYKIRIINNRVFLKSTDFKSKNIQIRVTDISGRLMQSQTISNENLFFSTDGFASGVYFLAIYNNIHSFSTFFVVR